VRADLDVPFEQFNLGNAFADIRHAEFGAHFAAIVLRMAVSTRSSFGM
jgi:hypothetical protein